MKKTVIATTLLAAPLLALAGTSNLVVNGSFEANAMSTGQWGIFPSLTGWSAGSLGVELRNNVAGTALHGNNFVELDTRGNSSISQVINTVAGQWYELSFAYSNRPGVSAASNGLAWSFGSAAGSAPVQAQIGGDHQWQLFSTLVQAGGSNMTLSFAATGLSDSYGSSLDRVAVLSVVPEPASYGLMLAGLATIAWLRARRRQEA